MDLVPKKMQFINSRIASKFSGVKLDPFIVSRMWVMNAFREAISSIYNKYLPSAHTISECSLIYLCDVNHFAIRFIFELKCSSADILQILTLFPSLIRQNVQTFESKRNSLRFQFCDRKRKNKKSWTEYMPMQYNSLYNRLAEQKLIESNRSLIFWIKRLTISNQFNKTFR